MTRRESSCSPCSSSAQSCEDLRCRSIPTYTITGPPSVEGRLGRGISPPRPERLGGPLLHDISPVRGQSLLLLVRARPCATAHTKASLAMPSKRPADSLGRRLNPADLGYALP